MIQKNNSARSALLWVSRAIFFSAFVILIVAAYFGLEEYIFEQHSAKATAAVISISAKNNLCKGTGKNRTSYDCTNFKATLSYLDLAGNKQEGALEAGSRVGHNQDTARALYQPGESIEIIYSETNGEIRLASYKSRYYFTGILCFCAVSDFIIGLILYLISKSWSALILQKA